ncbi:hypothetical protein [Candidatus Magnetobacterium casense]|uniref:hypothetical protein n=1 Tax=Candidatus Magnetobacterium casense TaxID=1455061 RepID=UPI0005917D7B|nr:hypothetical protein [Candidatus Magnetobacterium casensis]
MKTNIDLADIDRRLAKVESSWKNFLLLRLVRDAKAERKPRHPFGNGICKAVREYEYSKETEG